MYVCVRVYVHMALNLWSPVRKRRRWGLVCGTVGDVKVILSLHCVMRDSVHGMNFTVVRASITE